VLRVDLARCDAGHQGLRSTTFWLRLSKRGAIKIGAMYAIRCS